MVRRLGCACVLLVVLGGLASAGVNPNAKVAVHVLPHETRSCDVNFPTIDSSSEINHTYQDCGDVDFFPVFYGLIAYQGVDYGVTWPEEWGSCEFTTCHDGLTIDLYDNYGDPEVFDPGDGLAQAWFDCQEGSIVIPGYGWLSATTPGRICMVRGLHFYVAPVIADCNEGEDAVTESFCGGVCGAVGDRPGPGRSASRRKHLEP
jgi:hypothetical protein